MYLYHASDVFVCTLYLYYVFVYFINVCVCWSILYFYSILSDTKTVLVTFLCLIVIVDSSVFWDDLVEYIFFVDFVLLFTGNGVGSLEVLDFLEAFC